MKRLLLLSVFLLVCSTGCSTVGPYLADRGRDALDIVTLQAGGLGLGATGRLGPFQTGLFVEVLSGCGLRGGGFRHPGDFVMSEFFTSGLEGAVMNGGGFTFQMLFMGVEVFGADRGSSSVRERGKSFVTVNIGQENVPFFYRLYDDLPDELNDGDNPAFYTQIELAGGALVSGRVGVNPGELLDFVLGWFGVDIYGDDVGMERGRREEPEPE
jgi:hypothetical protein